MVPPSTVDVVSSSVARNKDTHNFFRKDGASCWQIINTVAQGQTSRTEQLDRVRMGNQKEFDGRKRGRGELVFFRRSTV